MIESIETNIGGFMYKGYRAVSVILSAAMLVMTGVQAEAAPLSESLRAGIAVNFDQVTDTEEETKATAEVVWTGTPLEGYTNIGIANVEDNLNIREAADTSSKLVGKMRANAACEVLETEGEWAHIKSGEVEGYVKTEFLYTGQEAIDLAFELGQAMAKVTCDALYVRMEPDTEADYWDKIPHGEELAVIEEMEDWVKVEIDGEEGYVAAEFVEINNELDTALTITEALYGEGVTDIRVEICEFAKQYVGNRYVWGGVSLTKGADCSGFVLAVYKNFGVSLPHSSRAQANCGTRISVSDVKPGDLIFYGNSSGINHVAMYIGGGRVVHASNSRTGIITSNMYYRSPVSAARIIQD